MYTDLPDGPLNLSYPIGRFVWDSGFVPPQAILFAAQILRGNFQVCTGKVSLGATPLNSTRRVDLVNYVHHWLWNVETICDWECRPDCVLCFLREFRNLSAESTHPCVIKEKVIYPTTQDNVDLGFGTTMAPPLFDVTRPTEHHPDCTEYGTYSELMKATDMLHQLKYAHVLNKLRLV